MILVCAIYRDNLEGFVEFSKLLEFVGTVSLMGKAS